VGRSGAWGDVGKRCDGRRADAAKSGACLKPTDSSTGIRLSEHPSATEDHDVGCHTHLRFSKAASPHLSNRTGHCNRELVIAVISAVLLGLTSDADTTDGSPTPMKRRLTDIDGGDLVAGPNLVIPRPSFPARNASIALVGLRGVGKSTIGVILSSTLRRRLIDMDMHFANFTGMDIAQFVSTNGWPAYRAKEAELLVETLRENGTDTVIVCSSGCISKPESRRLLQEWIRCHPVIHILRREEEVESYVVSQQSSASSPSELELALRGLRRLTAQRESLYAACSNFEFYNMWDKSQQPTTAAGRANPSSPTLKKVEQEILRLLSFVFQTEMAPLIVSDQYALHSTKSTTLEDRSYTHALVVPPSPSFDRTKQLDYEELGAVVQAFDLRVDNLIHQTYSAKPATGVLASLQVVYEEFGKLQRQCSIPIIYDVSTVRQGGCFPSSSTAESDYFKLLDHGLRLGAEYLVVDLHYTDERIRTLVERKGATKVIGSYFEAREGSGFGWEDPERRQIYDRAVALRCDLVKLSQIARSTEDNFAALAFGRNIRNEIEWQSKGISSSAQTLPPLIAFNTGKLGKMSRCFNKILSPVSHPLLQGTEEEVEELVPGEALRALHSAFIFPTRKFCIFGHDIHHSLSPAMHNSAYEVYGMPHNYSIRDASSINELLEVVRNPMFGGASISLPFKLEIIPLLHSMSDHAQIIGAVNTIVPMPVVEGTGNTLPALYGDNTDWIGIRTCTLRNLTPANAITSRTTALVIGAGGIARASIYALQKLGVENIFLCNRTLEHAEKLADYFNTQRRRYAPALEPSGSRSTLNSPGPKYRVRVLSSLQVDWPHDHRHPSIISSCIPAHSIDGAPPANLTLSRSWLRSPTGGVCIEACVQYFPPSKPRAFINSFFFSISSLRTGRA
jgi:3-dehydroquinate dehydratase type I